VALRIVAPSLLVVHVLIRFLIPAPQFLADVVLYHAVAIVSALAILKSPKFNNRLGRITLASALLLWSTGSILATWTFFYELPEVELTMATICYLLLYPCLFIGLPPVLRNREIWGSIKVLDSTILALGIASIGVAFLIKPVLPHFRGNFISNFSSLAFPILDIILISLTLTLFVTQPITLRSTIISMGVVIFVLSDFLLLWLTLHNRYALGSLDDDLWLFGIVLIAEGFSHRGSGRTLAVSLNPLFIAAAVLTAATCVAITVLRPGYLASYILAPAFVALCLAFIRMTIALRDARSIDEERGLARADELTGLPNRRRFIAELGLLGKSLNSQDALLLLDLDGFKPINDKYGHDIGDLLLKQVSLRFERALPQGSLLARLGGDEFGAVVRGDYETTIEAARALRATLSYPFSIAEHVISVGVSVGHVTNDGGADLLRRADKAMYQAKREGIGVWSEPPRNESHNSAL
jgi:diguanylate cyclase (GGDEF)-like protein